MDKGIRDIQDKFHQLDAHGKMDYIISMTDQIIEIMQSKERDIQHYLTQISLLKSFVSQLYRQSGVYRMEFFKTLVVCIKKLWQSLETCSSQILLYPALSLFSEFYSKLKGLNPFYTLDAVLNDTIKYGTFPDKESIEELLSSEQRQLSFLLSYMQLDSLLRFPLQEEERLQIIKAATNYIQLLVLTIFNFLVTIPVISRNLFISWCDLLKQALDKAIQAHDVLKQIEITGIGVLRTKLSESSIYAIKAQLYLLRARYLNENTTEALNQASMETTTALQELEPYRSHPQYAELVEKYYLQHKSIFLEIRFYQLLERTVPRQYSKTTYVGDLRDDKAEWKREVDKSEVEESLRELKAYINQLSAEKGYAEIAITGNMISTYAKIAYGALVYKLLSEERHLEELTSIRNLRISDPELSLLLAHYWLFLWNKTDDISHLENAEILFERAAETFLMLFNSRFIPIYCYSLLALIKIHRNEIPKADVYLMKADDEYNDAKALKLLNESEIYFYEEFRSQIEKYLQGEEIDKPLRFDKPFNTLDYKTWLSDRTDWRELMGDLPEPFPFHLDQMKIIEFEYQIENK